MSEPNARRYSLNLVDDPGHPAASGHSRRDFLKAAGFTFAGALLSGCQRAPEQEAVPPLIQTEEVVSGRASEYASTCGACSAGCGLLVKTRDGRPIKLEGNPDHPMSKGGLCAAGQASLLGLYDRLRLQHPLVDGRKASWDQIDREIRGQLDAIRRQGGAVRVLSGTITSPTTLSLLKGFLSGFSDARHVVYDPLSYSATLDAHKLTHGVRVLPRYHLDQADVIAGFDADFLGTWISPVEFTGGYRLGRTLTGNPPRSFYHVQVESRLSLTGSKADERICVAPDQIGAMLTCLAASLAKRANVRLNGAEWDSLARDDCDRLADRLWQARGHSLVLCGSQDVPSQVLCNFINHMLGNYGVMVDIERPSLQRQGSDQAVETLLGVLDAHKVAALFILDSNPVYDLPDGESLARSLGQVPLVVYCGERLDETANVSKYVCPHPHYLESWSDAEPASGILGLRQPTIPRLGDTRPVIESLAIWMAKQSLPVVVSSTVGSTGAPMGQGPVSAAAALFPGRAAVPAYDLVRAHWQTHVFPRQAKERRFELFWDHAVQDGFAEVTPVRAQISSFDLAAVHPFRLPSDDGSILVLYPKVGMPDGSHAYNPWLQELPDPISKVTWDNYACVSPGAAAQLGVGEGDVVRLEVRNADGKAKTLELPVFVQPGQHDRVVAVALGYGCMSSERFAGIGPPWLEARPTVGEDGRVGQNAAPLLAWENGTLRYAMSGVKLTTTSKKHNLASTQSHNSISVPAHLAPPSLERRPIIQETTLTALAASAPNSQPLSPEERAEKKDLWPNDHPPGEHRWGMVIDLNACTGCSACVIACQSENNIPVVGKDEVRRQREMHWLRIDRYYSGNDTEVEVAYQPMLCQHCERAPCETVCPVLATTHSDEGLNEQVYNRCVGTRYCANNCPYKVRRFNWFAYAHDDTLQNLALNPDVTVRSRGVMEKCTFCVQRLQEAKIESRRKGEPLHDGDVQTACQQSCPAKAIVFGDLNDPKSKVARGRNDPRHYQVLAELDIGPSVGYLKIVRNREEGEEGRRHG